MSRTSVRPVMSTQMTVAEPPRIFPRRDVPGMAGTYGGVCLRLCQFVPAAISLCVMVSTREFPSVPVFRFLIAAVALQSFWSLSLAFVDVYALLVGRSFRNYRAVGFFAIGDVATSTLTFAAACSSAGMTVVMGNGLYKCNANHCTRLILATAMAILSWLATSPSFLLNFWTLSTLSHDIGLLL